jgi:hypothetical protein
MASRLTDDIRPEPARVYPVDQQIEEWVVEAPKSASKPDDKLRTFNGSRALVQALEYAHWTYGSASHFSR